MKLNEVVTVLNTHAGGATTVVNENLEEIDELAPHVDPTHTHRLVEAEKGEQLLGVCNCVIIARCERIDTLTLTKR